MSFYAYFTLTLTHIPKQAVCVGDNESSAILACELVNSKLLLDAALCENNHRELLQLFLVQCACGHLDGDVGVQLLQPGHGDHCPVLSNIILTKEELFLEGEIIGEKNFVEKNT